jgi:hypothetical protein
MTLPPRSAPADVALPEDLRERTGEAGLVRFVLEAVQTVNVPRTGPAACDGAGNPLRPQVMLSVLTYAYGIGLYGSHQIALATLREGGLSYLCAGAQPDAQALRRFRRRHREHVKHCLQRVLELVYEFRLWLAHAATVPRGAGEAPAAGFTGSARGSPDFALAAEERLERAVLLDSVTLDE